VYKKLGDFGLAEVTLLSVLKSNDRNVAAWNNLGEVYWNIGWLENSIDRYRQALKLNPKLTQAHSNIILAMNYSDRTTQQDIIEESKRFVVEHHPNTWYRHGPRFPEKLRVGFVSPYFCANPVGRFLVSLFKAHEKEYPNASFYCYSDTPSSDNLTKIFKERSNVWRHTAGMPNKAVAQMIYDDQIDILFDLSGHVGGNRLPMFMMKPAPVQVEWMGYFNTTAVPEMDYFLVDDVCVPKYMEDFYTEKIVRMPDVYECYDPPDDAPDVGPCPALKNGYVTFICQQQLAKITPTTIKTWAEILHRLPDSKLIVRAKGLADKVVRRDFEEDFQMMGIDYSRLDLRGFCDSSEYYATYNEADITLAPIPFTGITTACDALWMGVPTVVLLGDSVGHRHAASVMSLYEEAFCVNTKNDYIDKAVFEANNPQYLESCRDFSRLIMVDSPLCNADLFYKNFIDICWKMWKREV
jgi:predicted O-linked N-acetylglucosamine transferase (SPINDLY family)